ncbi:MAG: serine/threonine-protein kinase [Acidobacteriota bacterium]
MVMVPAALPSAFEIGATIAETYTIEDTIGRGGMGIVLRARHARLPGKQVAIKVLDTRLATDDMLARFKREAHIVSVLAHPNIVHIEDYNVTPDGTPYLVLEYLAGETLAARLARRVLDVEAVLAIARQIGSALAAAHSRGVVHRDLKPHNIFLVPTEVGGTANELVKVLDFGISKLVDSDTVQTGDNALLGTPQYMAPEQIDGRTHAIDARTDVFSFGAIVYEMLAGRAAFAGSTLADVAHKIVYEPTPPLPEHVAEPVVAAVRTALAKAPADRFPSAGAFVEALTGKRISTPSTQTPRPRASAAFAATVDSGNVPGPTLERSPRARRRTLAIAGAGAIAVAVAIGAYVLARHGGEAQLDRDRMRAIAERLLTSDSIDVDGHRYRVTRVGTGQLRTAKFILGGHKYEAIEQNPETASHWADLARQGHHVVHFRDLATKAYLAVVVDGEPVDETTVEEEPR